MIVSQLMNDCYRILDFFSQMATSSWIQVIFFGVSVLHSVAAQSCSAQFQAVFAAVTSVENPPPAAVVADPDFTYYRESLRFTDEEIEQDTKNAIQHINTQFGLNFSNIEPNERGERVLGNATFRPVRLPFNLTAVHNRWIVFGSTRTRCFDVGAGGFEVIFTETTTLRGVYGGNEGRTVQPGDALIHANLIIYNACNQQPIIIRGQTDTPGRLLAAEGWFIEHLRLHNRWLGTGHLHSIYKFTANMLEVQQVFSFP